MSNQYNGLLPLPLNRQNFRPRQIEVFDSPFAIEGDIIKVGISIGIVEHLMQRADAVM